MKQSTKRLVSSFLALLFLVAAFMLFFSFIQPAYEDLKKTRSEELSRRVFTENQERVITQVQDLLAAYEGEGEVQEAISSALPLVPGTGEALTQLYGLTMINGLSPQSFAVTVPGLQSAEGGARKEKPAELVRPIGLVNFQMRFAGNYENFKALLRGLETNIRVFDVKSVSFQPAGRLNQNSYAYDLTVSAYYQSQ